jgi:hypothetical protein
MLPEFAKGMKGEYERRTPVRRYVELPVHGKMIWFVASFRNAEWFRPDRNHDSLSVWRGIESLHEDCLVIAALASAHTLRTAGGVHASCRVGVLVLTVLHAPRL